MKVLVREPPGVDAAMDRERATVSSQILRRVAKSIIFSSSFQFAYYRELKGRYQSLSTYVEVEVLTEIDGSLKVQSADKESNFTHTYV